MPGPWGSKRTTGAPKHALSGQMKKTGSWARAVARDPVRKGWALNAEPGSSSASPRGGRDVLPGARLGSRGEGRAGRGPAGCGGERDYIFIRILNKSPAAACQPCYGFYGNQR